MEITENFIREEFDCHDGTEYPRGWIMDRLLPLCRALEKIRALTGTPMHITSGYRTKSWNDTVGGAGNSQHLHGRAADIQLTGMPPKELYAAIEGLIATGEIPDGGLGLYSRWVHYDLRGNHSRWVGP